MQRPVWSLAFADGVDHEAAICEHRVVQNDTPVDGEGWVHGRVIELVMWIRLEPYPNW